MSKHPINRFRAFCKHETILVLADQTTVSRAALSFTLSSFSTFETSFTISSTQTVVTSWGWYLSYHASIGVVGERIRVSAGWTSHITVLEYKQVFFFFFFFFRSFFYFILFFFLFFIFFTMVATYKCLSCIHHGKLLDQNTNSCIQVRAPTDEYRYNKMSDFLHKQAFICNDLYRADF